VIRPGVKSFDTELVTHFSYVEAACKHLYAVAILSVHHSVSVSVTLISPLETAEYALKLLPPSSIWSLAESVMGWHCLTHFLKIVLLC